MSQWSQIQQLEMRLLEHVDYLYNDNFPMDIRQGLASWIEAQDWDMAADNESMAPVLFSNLLSQLEVALSQEHNFLQRHNMKLIQQQLQVKYASNPAAIARVISNCLKEERRILSSACMQEQGPLEKSLQNSVALERQMNMDHRIGVIRASVQMMDQGVKYIENLQDGFDFRYKTLQTRDPSERNSELMKQEVTKLQEILNRLDFKRKEILSKMAVVIKEIDNLMNNHLDAELRDWKRKQQMVLIGSPLLTSLDHLQSWFTLTAQSLFQVKRQLDKLGELVLKVTYDSDPIPMQKPQMEERVKYLISHIIKSSFVVEKQPCMSTHPQKPLIIKTRVQFTTKVRLLVILPAIDYHLKVKTTFDKDLPPGRVSRQFFIVTNTTKVMDIEDYSNGCLSVDFRHALKEKKYGNSTKNNESLLSVTEELHSLSFEAHFTIQGLNIDLETCSLPLVVISNVSQMPGAWASVMWYNLLNDEPKNLTFFSGLPRATWSQLSEVLGWQFSINSSQGLNKEQLNMLGEKLLGQHFSDSDQVYWSKFCKENIPGKPFSFWIWLDSILELIRKHLLPVWNENYIMGFVSKEMERALLREKESGTFLLRFSESHLGGITFTWVQHSDNGEATFNSVEPYTKSRLNALHFPDIIRDYKVISDGVVPKNPLKFLFPDIPKDEAFGRLYNNLPSKAYPYIPSTLIPCSEMCSNMSPPSPPCEAPEPPMTPGEFDMLNQTLCFDMDVVSLDGFKEEEEEEEEEGVPLFGNHVTGFSPVDGSPLSGPKMAQWQAMLRLDAALQPQVSQLYERKFPRHIRQYLSVWIENQDWHSASVDDQKARTCFNSLLVYLEEEWSRCTKHENILQGPDLPGIKEYVLNFFENKPKNLAAILFECLEEEKKILLSAQRGVCPAEEMRQTQLDPKIAELKRMSLEVSNEIVSLGRLHENFNFIHAEEQGPPGAVEQYNFFVQTKQLVLQQIRSILKMAEDVVQTLTTVELPEWKRRQQLACIGCPVDTCLDHLQKWFTNVAEVLQQIQQHLTMLPDPNGITYYSTSDSVAEMNTFTQSLITKLLSNALVVEKQPVMSSMPSIQRPLILKTKSHFTVRLRFLVYLPEFQCLLKVKPLFDKDVAENNKMKGFRHFGFTLDMSKVIDVDVAGHCLVAEFEDMVLQESKKRTLGSNESYLAVTEELHVITFVTDFQHDGLHCLIEARSLPVVVISATSQVPSAWASVMWYNMSTSEPMNLSLFSDPPLLSWPHLSQLLSWQFLSIGKRQLDENQLTMLRGKIVEDPIGFVNWNSFSKAGCKKNGNVWLWLDGILDLIKKHLVDLWRDGSIMGFVSREKIKELLQEKKTGTFLLRFSESNQDGAISISWVEHYNGEAQVHSIEPYTKTELANTPMPNMIYDFNPRVQGNIRRNPLLYLYPEVDKDAAFRRYYIRSGKMAPKPDPGYLQRKRFNVTDMPTPPPSPPPHMPMVDMFPSMAGTDDYNCQEVEILNLLDLSFSEQYQVCDFSSIGKDLKQDIYE
ncbi:signal transducer and activator of transcription 4 [Phyllopteryx taeniolatus]|uniref:signal transducer and activator of transcription 4 n=1 Tax=Phyllopteryx taeniolatus TaxID=161469 RepID=UPI002AD3C5E0|nr:signal transducer and activator of transcription 4 [Phyllopteryx taeniolatus]